MNSEQFLQEVLESEICPENFSDIYAEFQAYQQAAMKTLREFHRVCEKNKIDYQLAYGSLLGAIRDDGQIPWDYDIDVLVPYEQKDALVEVLKRDLNEDFYFYCPEIDPLCKHYMMRLAPVGYKTEAIHVDVFYSVGMPADPLGNPKRAQELYRLFKSRFLKMANAQQSARGNFRRWFRLVRGKLQLLFKPMSKLEKRFRFLCEEYPLANSKESGVVGDKIVLPTKVLWETMLYETQAGTFRITKNYEQILGLIYKDYRKIYPLESRLSELMRCYERITWIQNKN